MVGQRWNKAGEEKDRDHLERGDNNLISSKRSVEHHSVTGTQDDQLDQEEIGAGDM